MAIMDKITSLLPARRDRQDRSAAAFDAVALRDDLDRWIQRFFEEPGGLGVTDYPAAHLPEVRDTDKEVIVKMEVPGFDPGEIDLSLTNRELIISGERRDEQSESRKGGRVAAARYARFVHRLPLPPDVAPSGAEATVERGELTIRLPKTEAAQSKVRRIPVNA